MSGVPHGRDPRPRPGDAAAGAIGAFRELPFPRVRTPTIDTLRWGRKRHHVPVMVEVDVTAARERIRRIRAESGERISFTAWVVACVARAAAEHPGVHAMRHGRRRLVLFDDVDVSIAIERESGDEASPTLPMPYVLRDAGRKEVRAIHAEIRKAQNAAVGAGEVQVDSPRSAWLTALFTRLPAPLRDLLVWRRLNRDAFFAKRTMGTVMVTSIGLPGQDMMSWGIPIGLHPLLLAVGGIAHRPTPSLDDATVREMLGLTLLFDHDVTDGAPVARFAARLRELMTGAYGLEARSPEG